MKEIKISHLFIYPVKSLAGISLQESALDGMGLKYDRRWMLVSPDGMFLSQRKVPKMALIRTSLNELGKLTLSAKGQKDHHVAEINSNSKTMSVRIWKDTLEVKKVGQESDAWLSETLGIDCHLVFITDDIVRQCDLDYANEGDKTGFSDGFPILLISQASLDDLNTRLEKPVEMRRFRPNIVVKGCNPYDEDNWKLFFTSSIEMKGVKLCSRCILTTVDPETGERSGEEPLATLSTYRKQGRAINFGLNVIQQSQGVLKVNDSIKLSKTRGDV